MIFSSKYLVRKRALGDVLWMEPIISTLSQSSKQLVVHSKYNQLFENYPNENVVFKNELNFFEKVLIRLASFSFLKNWVINLDGAYENFPKIHLLHAYQKQAGLPMEDKYPEIFLSTSEKAMYAQLHEQEPYIVMHIENKALKNYRKAFEVDWKEIIDKIRKDGKQVYLIGAEDLKLEGATYLRTSIREMIALIYRADLFIGIDSGPSHIAASLQIPALIFFGAVNPDFRHFRKQFKGVILQEPCLYAGCFHEFKEPDDVFCRIVGDNGIPPCCSFSTLEVKKAIDFINENYCKNEAKGFNT